MNQQNRRVVVTGLGAVTPVGNTVEETWNSLVNGIHGIGLITQFDTTEMKAKLGAEVKNFDPRDYMFKLDVSINGEGRDFAHRSLCTVCTGKCSAGGGGERHCGNRGAGTIWRLFWLRYRWN